MPLASKLKEIAKRPNLTQPEDTSHLWVTGPVSLSLRRVEDLDVIFLNPFSILTHHTGGVSLDLTLTSKLSLSTSDEICASPVNCVAWNVYMG